MSEKLIDTVGGDLGRKELTKYVLPLQHLLCFMALACTQDMGRKQRNLHKHTGTS